MDKEEILEDAVHESNDKASFRNISYSKRDIYYRKAKEEGFRARSVYKLKEINDNYKILENAENILDLCAAPGSWTQMLRILSKNNKNAKVVAVDIQDIVPIEGVDIIKGDITKKETIDKILNSFGNKKADVVIFDGAPDVTGLVDIDMYMQVQLIIFSLLICLKVLKTGGKFVAKIFKSDEEITDFYYEKTKILFENVYYFKPSSSRNTSHETYLIAEVFGVEDQQIYQEIEKMNIEQILKMDEVNGIEVKKFLKFLCEGEYN